jgi:hypothetical protein
MGGERVIRAKACETPTAHDNVGTRDHQNQRGVQLSSNSLATFWQLSSLLRCCNIKSSAGSDTTLSFASIADNLED